MDTAPWLLEVSEALAVPAPEDQVALLDLTREIAHAVERPAGPLTLFMLGCAVGAGGDAADLIARVRATLASV